MRPRWIWFPLLAQLCLLTAANARECPHSARAGVLPYAFDSNRKLRILLAGETSGSGYLWSEFIGGIKQLESPTDAAAAELWQGTRHAFHRDMHRSRLPRAEAIERDEGKTCLYLMEVSFVHADRLNELPQVPSGEKDRYCWILLEDLMKSIEAASEGEGGAEVPRECGGASRSLDPATRANLKATVETLRSLQDVGIDANRRRRGRP